MAANYTIEKHYFRKNNYCAHIAYRIIGHITEKIITLCWKFAQSNIIDISSNI